MVSIDAKTKKVYEKLVDLYKTYGKLGLQIVAVPCNQCFLEPGLAPSGPQWTSDLTALIKKMNIEFPVLERSDIYGENALPIFKHLSDTALVGKEVKTNFNIFVCN